MEKRIEDLTIKECRKICLASDDCDHCQIGAVYGEIYCPGLVIRASALKKKVKVDEK